MYVLTHGTNLVYRHVREALASSSTNCITNAIKSLHLVRSKQQFHHLSPFRRSVQQTHLQLQLLSTFNSPKLYMQQLHSLQCIRGRQLLCFVEE